MAQMLRAIAAFQEDPGLVPSKKIQAWFPPKASTHIYTHTERVRERRDTNKNRLSGHGGTNL